MAVNRGLETFLSVFLLCCWYGTDLQPINSTSGTATGRWVDRTLAWMPWERPSPLCPFLSWELGEQREPEGFPSSNVFQTGMPGSR